MKKTLFIFLLLASLHTFADISLQGKISSYNFSQLKIEDGLPNNYVDDIFKDSKGFLWVSTSNGLSRYDGYEFRHYHTSSDAVHLKSNFVKKVCEDNFNRLWIGTEEGVDVLDMQTNRLAELNLPPGVLKQGCSHVFNDSEGCIWIISVDNLYKISFNEAGQVSNISTLTLKQEEKEIQITTINQIDKEIWIGYNHSLYKVTQKQATLSLSKALPINIFDTKVSTIHCLLQKNSEIWIGTNRGLYCYNKETNSHQRYRHVDSNPTSLSQSYITALALGTSGEIIAATLKGLNFYNSIEDNFIHIMQTKVSADGGLSCNFVNSLLVDDESIWIGTEIGGLNRMTLQSLLLQKQVHDKDNPGSLSDNPVNSIFEDSNGNLWVGTVEGGLNLKLKGEHNFIHFTHSPTDINSISHNSISVITQDNKNRLWVGTWGMGVNVTSLDHPGSSTRFVNYSTEKKYNLKSDFITSMCFDSINNGMWISTNEGLHFFNFTNNRLDYIPLGKKHSYSNSIGGMCIDRKACLWIGASKGLFKIDLLSFAKSHSDFTPVFKKCSIIGVEARYVERINCIYEDSNGNIWVGSNGNGLSLLKEENNNEFLFSNFTIKDELPNNNVLSILEDDYKQLWVSTNYGLSCFNPKTKSFRNFTANDGIMENQFYWNAAFKSPLTGTMYFGNLAGMIALKGYRNSKKKNTERVVLTKLSVLNEVIYQGGNEYLNNDITCAKKLELHESDKSFSIEFSALNYTNTKAIKYAYRLKGFDDQWTETDGLQHWANYTNLSAGKYTFQVKVLSTNVSDQDELTELFISIKPFFYKTWWFYSIVIMIIFLSAASYYLWRISELQKQKKLLTLEVQSRTEALENKTIELSNQNIVLKEQYEKVNQQKIELVKISQKLKEVTEDKIAFFTNITHEFRTPITLITGPIERAIQLSYNPEVLEQLHIVDRNSKSLLLLVNQLLDFRKVESNTIQLNKKSKNIVCLIDEIVVPFHAFATERNIRIQTYYRINNSSYYFDEEWIRKVVVNLLSNAIKFTPNSGLIKLYVSSFTQENTQKDKIYLCVNDSGIGIQEKDVNLIFNRFYQSKKSTKFPVYGQSGTGIGLYLCERIIRQHGGSIIVKNNKKQGASFRVMLYLKKSMEQLPEKESLLEETIIPSEQQPCKTTNGNKKTILIVDDNQDMRRYIRSILCKTYHTLEAENGKEALNILYQSDEVDFIISDIMMPIMNGLEFSRKVKENIATSHIPVLMLTAKSSDENRMESYKIGVDEYLIKPFDENILLLRIENILKIRQQHHKLFKINMDPSLLNIDEESKDKKFMDKVMEIVSQNYKDSEFEVIVFSGKMGMSKTLLNTKLQELTGQSIAKFIRSYRLKAAQKIIETNSKTRNMNISEIAYEVGFNDPKYFTRVFSNHFGVSPSSLMDTQQ